MNFASKRGFLIACSAVALAACGGGGGGMSFIPAPPVTPPPPPPPPATAPIPPDHLGLISKAPFAVLATSGTFTLDSNGQTATQVSPPAAHDVQFSFDPVSNTYRITIAGFQPGTLTNTSYNGSAGEPASSSYSQVSTGNSTDLQPLHVYLPVPGVREGSFTYTSFGNWTGEVGTSSSGETLRQEGYFAYGIPTAPGDVPVTGSANYAAQVLGSIGSGPLYWIPVSGNVDLSFDFGAGKLSGSMHAGLFDDWDGVNVDFGKYEFTQTVFSKGSTTFSGKFIVPGLPNADSSFTGMFTGPNAAELMARFQAPYLYDGQQGTMGGVWVGKKN